MVGHALREIAEAGVDPHLAIGVEPGRIQVDATFELPVDADPVGAGIPPVAVRIPESGAVSRADHETAGLVADRVVRCIGERPERVLADVHAGGIDVVFRAGRGVLQVIAPVVPVHPRAFDIRRDAGVAVVQAEALPAVIGGVGAQQRQWPGEESHALAFTFGCLVERQIELRTVDREHVGRIPVQVDLAVVILEQTRVPRTGWQVARLHTVFMAFRHRAGNPRQHACPEMPAAMCRVGGIQQRPRPHRRFHQEQLAIRDQGGRCNGSRERPLVRLHERPAHQVVGTPVTIRQRQEQVVRTLVAHDRGVRAGAVRDALVHLLVVVTVVDVERIDPGAATSRRDCGRHERAGKRQREAGPQHHLLPDSPHASSMCSRPRRCKHCLRNPA